MRLAWLGCAVAGLLMLWNIFQPDLPVRDVPLSRQLPDGPLRITVFGTSLTAPPQSWPDALSQRLALCRHSRVDLSRVAKPGMGSHWALGQIDQVIKTSPDLVLIEFAINDADLRDGVSLSVSRNQHLQLIEKLQVALPDAALVLMTMNPARGPRGWIRPFLTAHYGQYHDLALQNGIGLVDLYPLWLSLPNLAQGLEGDGLHPDPGFAENLISATVSIYLDQDRKCP